MGGDGTVTALVNAMMYHAQRGRMVSTTDATISSPTLPIAIIPNGLCASYIYMLTAIFVNVDLYRRVTNDNICLMNCLKRVY